MNNSSEIFRGFKLEDTTHLGPDNEDFFKFDLNIAALTKYGRYVFIQNGNEHKCSSFFATLCTIINKLELSFGRGEQPANLKKIAQGNLNLFLLRRGNFMYICWTKLCTLNQLTIYSAMEFLHYQMMSSLTGKVDKILDQNQTYDPSINFGKGRSVHNLLYHAVANGLYSLALIMNAIPILPLHPRSRTIINSLLRDNKQQGLQINILMTMNSLVAIFKKKDIDLDIRDIFLLFNLVQSQSLRLSENWFPICLPGVDSDDMVFCYLNYLNNGLIHIMIADDAQIFQILSQISRNLKKQLQNQKILEKLIFSNQRKLINDPSLQRMNFTNHFLVKQLSHEQILISSGNYFGQNISPEYTKYWEIYSHLNHHLKTTKHQRKQKLHVQVRSKYLCGYYEENSICLMFITSLMCDLEDAKAIISALLKFIHDEDNGFFIGKII